MAKIYPFRSLRYALDRVPIEKVVTQPYDKISPKMQERYYSLHPNNIVRIICGKSSPDDSPANNVYTRAAGYLKRWRETGSPAAVTRTGFFHLLSAFQGPG